ncbi:Innexin inx2 [Halotydeus destructor]|nr:Innexin inx2 [Halotydeus destructor]
MFDFFGSIQAIIKLDSVCIDNHVFRLHYKVTVIFLITASLLVTGKEYFGDPIDCVQPNEEEENDFLDTFCWIHSTFTLPDAYDKKVGSEVPYPGVDKHVPGDRKTYHKYYQWVCFALFFQAVSFYAPRYLWKRWEAGRLRAVVQELGCPINDDKSGQLGNLAAYLRNNLRHHDAYFFQFVLCEILNLMNVLVNIYLVDLFLGGAFSTFGLDVLKYTEMNQEERTDPMIRMFPRMTKCTFHFFGSSGDVQKHDALCILPLNIINEKIYIFLWFWLMALAAISTVNVAYRLAVIASPRLRCMVIKSRGRLAEGYQLNHLTQNMRIGDWFVLYQLCKNMDALNFKELVNEVTRAMKAYDSNGKTLINIDKRNGDAESVTFE